MLELRVANENRSFRLTVVALFVVAALFVSLLGGMAAAAVEPQSESGKLVATGRAELTAVPDMAVFSVGVETRAETVEEARNANAAAVDAVRNSLLEAGATESSLQTRSFFVNADWRHDPRDGTRTLVGYVVSHTIEVTVDDLSRLGALMDAALQRGANQISGPTFGLRSTEKLQAAALQEAVRKARAKADVLAAATGVSIRGVAHISEQVNTPIGGGQRMMAATDAAMESVPTPISPGEISVTATVTITYEI